MLLGMKPISSVADKFENLIHYQYQRLAIRSRIAGLQADVHRVAMNLLEKL
jgi:hypothetical protein